MQEILQRLIKDNFSELGGLNLQASIPLPEYLINEFITEAVRGNKNITDCRVSIYSQNRISIDLKTPLWPWPINLKLRLENAVDLGTSPRIKASLENHSLLGKLGSALKAFPDGISINNDQVVIDLGSFVAGMEYGKMLDLIQSIHIMTESARIFLDVRIAVSE
jgi:hypothetical protein